MILPNIDLISPAINWVRGLSKLKKKIYLTIACFVNTNDNSIIFLLLPFRKPYNKCNNI